MLEKEAEDFLEKNKFSVVKRTVVTKEKDVKKEAKRIGFPLVMKVTNTLHKTEKKGVVVGITEESIQENYKKIAKKSKKVMFQRQLDGKELILGIKKDPVFGHTILVGAGGVYTEFVRDIALRICPITRVDAQEMLEELKIYKILTGTRKTKVVNTASVINVLIKLSKLVEKYKKIKELDINPLIVNEVEARIADARIIFE